MIKNFLSLIIYGSVIVSPCYALTGRIDAAPRDPCCRQESYQLQHPALIGLLDGLVWYQRAWPDDLVRSSYSRGYEDAFIGYMIQVTKPVYGGWRRIGQGISLSVLVFIGWKLWKKKRV